jgi:hypothetical protein
MPDFGILIFSIRLPVMLSNLPTRFNPKTSPQTTRVLWSQNLTRNLIIWNLSISKTDHRVALIKGHRNLFMLVSLLERYPPTPGDKWQKT